MKNIIFTLFCMTIINYQGDAQFKNIGGDGKAIVSDIIVNGDTIYTSCHTSLHKSYDGGQTWEIIPGSQTLGDIESFHISGDIIIAINVAKETDDRNMTIHTSKDGGLHWVKKDIFRYYTFYGIYDNELSITIHRNIITVSTYDEIFISKDFGETFGFFNNKDLYHFRSDYIYYQNGYHYVIEHKKVTRTNDFITFTDVYVSASGNISGFFKNSNTIYIYDSGALQLAGDVFEEININPSLFENYKAYSFDEDFIYTYKMSDYEVHMYDNEFNYIQKYDFSNLFELGSEYNKFSLYGGFIYYFNSTKFGFYKKQIAPISSSAVEIAGNINGAKGEYVMVDNSLWQIASRLSYYNKATEQWKPANIKYGDNDYAVVDQNAIIITQPVSIVNLSGVKIRNTSFPNDYGELFNCNDIVMVRDFTQTKIYTLIGGILPWIEIDEEIKWENIKTEFSNKYYIIHNEKDEMLYTQDKYTWRKIKLNPATIENLKISSVQVDLSGNIYLTAGKSLYKHNPTNEIWEKINASYHPYQNEIITDFAMYKDIMVQTKYGKGVVISNDLGLTWQTFNNGLADRFVEDILFSDTHLYITNRFEVYERQLSDIPGLSYTENDLSNLEKSLIVYPNPSTSILNYELPIINESTSIYLFNSDDKLVFQQKDGTTIKGQIDMQAMPSGIYFLKINSINGTVTKKIVKL